MTDLSLSEIVSAAAATLLGGGVLGEVFKKVLGRPKESAEMGLLAAQARKTAAETPTAEGLTLKMVLDALDVMQRTSAERERATIERERLFEERENSFRQHIETLEAKIDELSDQLDSEKRERRKLQEMLSKACSGCDVWQQARLQIT